MSLETEITPLLVKKEGNVEYKPILPPSRSVAQLIAGFANTNGGYLVLGATDTPQGIKTPGISSDFNVSPVTHRAIDMLSHRPELDYGYVNYNGIQLFVIKVKKSVETIKVDGKEYRFIGKKLTELNPEVFIFRSEGYLRIRQLSELMTGYIPGSTVSKVALISHYQGLLKIIDNLKTILFPAGPAYATAVPEGKILSKMLYSSAVDNFEVFLADLLYEISLAKPETLKSTQTITIEDVLNCSDMEEFVKLVAKKKINKLQKGSMKEFLKENPSIAALKVMTDIVQADLEKILQIRHLYTHRNGIIDEKFLPFYSGSLTVGAEYLLPIDEMLDKLKYLVEIVELTDRAAVAKYRLG